MRHDAQLSPGDALHVERCDVPWPCPDCERIERALSAVDPLPVLVEWPEAATPRERLAALRELISKVGRGGVRKALGLEGRVVRSSAAERRLCRDLAALKQEASCSLT